MPGAKLTPEQVVLIRRRYARENITLTRLAEEYGLNYKTADRIVRGEAWKNLPGTWDPELWDYPITQEGATP